MGIFSIVHERFPNLYGEENFCFARHTTIGCGGVAAAVFSPSDEGQLAELLRFLKRQGIASCFLGAGANVLAADGFFDGAVIRFNRLSALHADGQTITAGAGVTGGRLLCYARSRHLGGAEFLTGIPMTVGGATVMNAGVREGHIGDLVEEVYGVAEGKLQRFSAAACAFGEKKSVFQSGIAVVRVTLRLQSMSEAENRAQTAFFRRKRAHLPRGRSMGCVFVNPEGYTAGALIESCGLKGLSVGGAHVSTEHANFILNDGGTSADVEALIDRIKESVLQKTGILLTEEIRRIP